MNKSNIFVYMELSKLVEELKLANETKLKDQLKSKSAYFKTIDPKFFSDSLKPEWEEIVQKTKEKGVKLDEEGHVISNAIFNTIENFTPIECKELVEKVIVLYEKVKVEFE